MALVVFLPRPENQGKIWVPSYKKSQSPEVALVDFSPDGRPWRLVNQDQVLTCILGLGSSRSLLMTPEEEVGHISIAKLENNFNSGMRDCCICGSMFRISNISECKQT